MNENSKKFALTGETKIYNGVTLYRIKALKDIKKYGVVAGDLGGFVQYSSNLSQEDASWIKKDSILMGSTILRYDSLVMGAVLADVEVHGRVTVYDSSVRDTVLMGDSTIKDSYISSAIFKTGAKAYSVRVAGILNPTVETTMSRLVRGEPYLFIDAPLDYEFLEGNTLTHSSQILTFKNTWSSGRTFYYCTLSRLWSVGCFNGTGEELIKKAYGDSTLSGKMYESYVHFAESLAEQFTHYHKSL